jgi:putative DNA primase/helicase
LKRKRPDEWVENFRHDRTEELDQLARMCARWASDNIARLRRADPAVPPNLYNRAADNWRPLLAIADAAGGDWPARAREIAAKTVDADQAKRVGLLADIRDVFEARGIDRIKSADLAAALVAIEGHPWAEHGRSGKPLSANGLARMLGGDNISPSTVRFGTDTAKGYELAQFADVFARYLPAPPNPTVTPSQVAENLAFREDTQPASGCYGLERDENPSIPAGCDGVTVEKPGVPPKSERVRFRL